MKAIITTIAHNPIKSILSLLGIYLMFRYQDSIVPYVALFNAIMWEKF